MLSELLRITRIIRWLSSLVTMFFCVWTIFFLFPKDAVAEVVASVNQKEISEEEFEEFRRFQNAKLLFDGQVIHSNPGRDQLGALLDQMIELEILYQEAGNKGIHISGRTITKEINAIESSFSNTSGLKAALKEAGIAEGQFKTFIEKGIAIQKLLHQEIFRNISISPDQVKRYYVNHQKEFIFPETVRLGHIWIRTAPGESEAKKNDAHRKILFIQNRLRQGDRFSILSIEFSDGIERYKGGDAGFVNPEELDPVLERAVGNLREGEVSSILETHEGYHLIKLLSRKPSYFLTFDSVQNEIEKALLYEKQQKAAISYIHQLKQRFMVKVNNIY